MANPNLYLMKTILITNQVEIASYAQSSGIDIIMVDLEILGKRERQNNLDTFITDHKLSDLQVIRECLTESKMLVRINPINKNSKKEIDSVIEHKPDYIMLPMFSLPSEVDYFLKCVNGRSKTILLFETVGSVCNVEDILSINGLDLAYVGLNDLSLELKLDFLFELLSGGVVEYLSKKFKEHNINFGFGGISRIDSGTLDPKLILSEHVRIGSQYVILSRSFHNNSKNLFELKDKIDLKSEIKKIKDLYRQYSDSSSSSLEKNKFQLVSEVNRIIK